MATPASGVKEYFESFSKFSSAAIPSGGAGAACGRPPQQSLSRKLAMRGIPRVWSMVLMRAVTMVGKDLDDAAVLDLPRRRIVRSFASPRPVALQGGRSCSRSRRGACGRRHPRPRTAGAGRSRAREAGGCPRPRREWQAAQACRRHARNFAGISSCKRASRQGRGGRTQGGTGHDRLIRRTGT